MTARGLASRRGRARRCLAALIVAAAWAAAAGAAEDQPFGTFELLPHIADEVMVRWDVPGLALGVVRADGEIFVGGFGTTRMGGAEPVTRDTIFGVGSITKPITALTVAVLVDEGRLEWDAPVRRALPDLRLHDLYASLHVTPRDLLCHRTGMARHDLVWYHAAIDLPTLVNGLQFLEPRHPLRSDFGYSNLMYAVAGALVGEVTGGTWADFAASRVLTPLGMERSSFEPPASDSKLARPHVADEDGTVREVSVYSVGAAAPAAGMYSTAADLGSFVRMMLNRGRVGDRAVVPAAVVSEVLSPHVALRDLGPRELPLTSYGLGWFVGVYRGHLYAWHAGSIDGYHALVSLLPYDDLGVVVLTNKQDNQAPEVLSRWVFDRVLGLPEINWQGALTALDQRIKEVQHDATFKLDALARPDLPPSLPLAAYTGRYRHPVYGELNVLQHEDGLIGRLHDMTGPVVHSQDDVFVFKLPSSGLVSSFVVGFSVTPDGEVVAAWSPFERDVEPIVFRRVPEQPAGDGT